MTITIFFKYIYLKKLSSALILCILHRIPLSRTLFEVVRKIKQKSFFCRAIIKKSSVTLELFYNFKCTRDAYFLTCFVTRSLFWKIKKIYLWSTWCRPMISLSWTSVRTISMLSSLFLILFCDMVPPTYLFFMCERYLPVRHY